MTDEQNSFGGRITLAGLGLLGLLLAATAVAVPAVTAVPLGIEMVGFAVVLGVAGVAALYAAVADPDGLSITERTGVTNADRLERRNDEE